MQRKMDTKELNNNFKEVSPIWRYLEFLGVCSDMILYINLATRILRSLQSKPNKSNAIGNTSFRVSKQSLIVYKTTKVYIINLRTVRIELTWQCKLFNNATKYFPFMANLWQIRKRKPRKRAVFGV